ncbi:MAG: helix-turn-helix domain-containing protein [Chloroflexota bacterium]|nr:helix-turn-helix domain-containing protein [Chloroflexota bacterium]
MLRHARRAAGLTQRALATSAGVPQSTVARIERGQLSPRVDTLERLLAVAGQTLSSVPVAGAQHPSGAGVDRTQIRALLALTPAERARLAVADAIGLDRVLAAAERGREEP